MNMLENDNLNRDTRPLYFSGSCYDNTMLNDYDCDHYNYTKVLILNFVEQQVNNLSDTCSGNTAWQNLDEKNNDMY